MHDIRSSLVRHEQRMPLARKASGGRPAKESGGLSGIRIRRDEARKVDQRREDRHLNVIDQAAIRHKRQSRDVKVLNVSSRGTMVECDLVPPIGDPVDIRFADCNRTSCFVRWVRDGKIGLEFARETLIIGAERDERMVSGRRFGEQPSLAVKAERAPRQCLILRGELHMRDGSMPVRLRNISKDGAMLEGTRNIEPPAQIVLELAGGVAIEGRVRWCRSKQIGIHFDGPFDVAVLARPPDEEKHQPDYLKPDYLRSDGQPDSPWSARRTGLTADDL